MVKMYTLFKAKICNFNYPIYGLTKNFIPHVWPEPDNQTKWIAPLKTTLMNLLFESCSTSRFNYTANEFNV